MFPPNDDIHLDVPLYYVIKIFNEPTTNDWMQMKFHDIDNILLI